jgi:hypothetical protein
MIEFIGIGWKPVIAVPGLTPKFPVMSDAPSFVTVVAPRTVKVDTEPNGTADALTLTDLESGAIEPCGLLPAPGPC